MVSRNVQLPDGNVSPEPRSYLPKNIISEATAGAALIKGGSIQGNRNGSMIKVRGHPHLGVRGRERIFKEVRGRPAMLEQDETCCVLKVRGSFSR